MEDKKKQANRFKLKHTNNYISYKETVSRKASSREMLPMRDTF